MLQVYLMCMYEQWRRNEFESEGTRPALNIFCRDPLKVQLVVLVSAFEIASTVWSVYCFLQSRRHCVYICMLQLSALTLAGRRNETPRDDIYGLSVSFFFFKCEQRDELKCGSLIILMPQIFTVRIFQAVYDTICNSFQAHASSRRYTAATQYTSSGGKYCAQNDVIVTLMCIRWHKKEILHPK